MLCWLWPWAHGAAAAGTKVAIVHGEFHVLHLFFMGNTEIDEALKNKVPSLGRLHPSEPPAACQFSAERESPLAG